MNQEYFEKMWKGSKMEMRKVKILIGGRTGVGKSSTINALIEQDLFKTDIIECTKENQMVTWETDVGDIIVQDVPGFSAADAPNLGIATFKDNIIAQAEDAHIFIYVFRSDDRIQQSEIDFLREWKSNQSLSLIPVIIVFNRIDCINPVRDWNPDSLNLINPTSDKEKNIVRYVKEQTSRYPILGQYENESRIILISAGENSTDKKYGINDLRITIKKLLPEALKVFMEREKLSIHDKAHSIIKYYAGVCAAVAIEPIPLVDSLFIAPVQITMIVHLGRIHKRTVSKDVVLGIINSVGLSFLGNYIFLGVIGFIPGVKQIAGPAIAFGLTYTAGLVVNELFSSGNTNPSEAQIKELVEKYKKDGKKAKEQYEKTGT